MKNFLLLSLLLFFSYMITFAQEHIYSTVIERNDPSYYYIVDQEQDSIVVFLGEEDRPSLEGKDRYRIIRGEGREKDEKGDREREKKYLLNSTGDTLATIRGSYKEIEFEDGYSIRLRAIGSGWEAVDVSGKIVAHIDLLWNDAFWHLTLQPYQDNEHLQHFNAAMMMSFVRMAWQRSTPENDDSDFWFVMWLLALSS